MNVIWTPDAEQQRAEIFDYIATENPSAAVRMDELFSEAAANLATYQKFGKPGRVFGTRELFPHESYRLVYEVSDDTVWVLALVHAARLWPPADHRD